jgi:CheY-like chemotaxis protein
MQTATVTSRRARVLVVDDEPFIAVAIGRLLGEHDVFGVISGELALTRLERGERFDVIFCDMAMPTMSGVELHAQVRERFPSQAERIVFLTGGAFTPTAFDFLETIGNQRLGKPFEPALLRSVVKQHVTGRP